MGFNLDAVDVIVNADDLGANSEVNEAVFGLIDQYKISSATVIANGLNTEEACRTSAQFPQCSFGVHLNISEFEPLTGPQKLESLLDEKGELSGTKIREIPIDGTLAQGIFEEFCAQISLLQAMGMAVSHIDSHLQVHAIPRVFPILKKIQRRFNIRKVRISRNIYALDENPSWTLKIKKSAYNFLLRNYYKTVTTDGLTDFRTFYELSKMLRPDHRTVELIVHPGSRAFDYEDEANILRGPWQDALMFPVRMVNYSEIR